MMELELETYGESAAQEILRLAGAARKRIDRFSREDLIRAAAEMDVPPEAVIEAERLVRERQSEADDRAEYKRAKSLEVLKAVAVGVPLLAIILFGHSVGVISHAFGAIKGLMKGVGALFFSKSTEYELEFQTWRNRRFYKAEYGGHEHVDMIDFFYHRARRELRTHITKAETAEWLVEANGMKPEEAKQAVQKYAEDYAHRFRPPRT